MSNVLLSITKNELESLGALHTAKEITQQPNLWLKTYDLVAKRIVEIDKFVFQVLSYPDMEIIRTGAGSSAFIAEIVAGTFQKHTGKAIRVLRTTELITHPLDFLSQDKVPLIVPFARSRNSPKSCAAVALAEKICKKLHLLTITCNENGALAKATSKSDGCLIALPPETNDQSLVMTSSFTFMAVDGLLIARIKEVVKLKREVEKLALYGGMLLTTYLLDLKKIASKDFRRAVFLGSGCMYLPQRNLS